MKLSSISMILKNILFDPQNPFSEQEEISNKHKLNKKSNQNQ